MELEDYYKDAVKKGKRQYLSQGKLICLEDILKNEDTVSYVNLGLMEIPLKKIVGTYAHLRSVSFSKDFMPMMNLNSEFAAKWMSLCKYHLEEGISDAIKVYEYLNYYYVIEGNKRVSLLKYLKAYSITAEVIRVLPERRLGDKTNLIYYKFLDFYNKSKINSIWFTREQSFTELGLLLNDYNPNCPKEDKYKHFESFVYNTFRDVYLKLGGQKLPITTGDAFLEYAKIYGINKPLAVSGIVKSVKALMRELSHFNDESVDIQTDSNEESSKVISTISNFIIPSKKLKVAFVYARSIQSSGWANGHEVGRKYVEEKLSKQVATKYIQCVPENEQAYDYIKSLAEEGNDVIFTTSPIFRTATLKCALEYKNIKFFNCSDDRPYEHMSCYFGRIYEAMFLTGIIAGCITKTNIIGYSATAPTNEVISSINSFALGAKIVNPYSEVKVAWTNEWNSHEKFITVENELIAKGCDIISNRNIDLARVSVEEYGSYSMLYSIEKGCENKYLAEPIWNWGIYYEKILNSILNDNFKHITNMFTHNSKLINFWYGIGEGVVDVYYSKETVPITVQKLVVAMRTMIINKEFNIFTGPIMDNKGEMRLKEDEVSTPDELLNMDWFVDNVEVDDYIK